MFRSMELVWPQWIITILNEALRIVKIDYN